VFSPIILVKESIGHACSIISERRGRNILEITIKQKKIDSLIHICKTLKTIFGLTQCLDLFLVHYPTAKKKKQYQINYIFLYLAVGLRVRLKFNLSEQTRIPSITPLFKSANWLERESYDMFGIIFTGHPDLRRILTDYGFIGHPLRKDFPVSGYQECFYSYGRKHIIYKPIKLAQFARTTTKTNPWIIGSTTL
jgi:NADH:ubiquinone oxidoreductase subunit C